MQVPLAATQGRRFEIFSKGRRTHIAPYQAAFRGTDLREDQVAASSSPEPGGSDTAPLRQPLATPRPAHHGQSTLLAPYDDVHEDIVSVSPNAVRRVPLADARLARRDGVWLYRRPRSLRL